MKDIPLNHKLLVLRYDMAYNQGGKPAILALVGFREQAVPVSVDEVLIEKGLTQSYLVSERYDSS